MAQNCLRCKWKPRTCVVGLNIDADNEMGGRFLDAKDATSLEYKLDSFSSVYRRLTGKEVTFEFPVQAQE